MSGEYRNNHYVPIWYQKRFLLPDARNELFYLDRRPKPFTDPQGGVHHRKAVKRTGLSRCFAQTDLYTTHFGSRTSTELEQIFFGKVDSKGREAVEYFAAFEHPSAHGPDLFTDMMSYMTLQKLRTPKGLAWLAQEARAKDHNETLQLMVRLERLYATLWAECVWLIADASFSATKFIISDHPVTVYNRRCGPCSSWCRGCKDPDIGFHASQTVFALSLDKVLLLTNLSWVRNPYQLETGTRPNPNPWRGAVFNFTEIQTRRHLTEAEVRQINFIIKSRALRYVGAAKEEWLFPDQYVSKSDWHEYGDGYLLMPDPRPVHLGGEVLIGYDGGGASRFDEYGRRPWEKDYGKESAGRTEARTLYRFQGEFARLFGPYRRGRTWNFGKQDDERDSDEFHDYHLSLEKGKKRKAQS